MKSIDDSPREVAQLGSIMSLIASGEASTRTDLARRTGMSASTISQRANTLIDAGLLVDEGLSQSTGGRRATLLRINPDAGVIVTAVLGASSCRCALVDFHGRVLVSATITLAVHEGPASCVKSVLAAIARLLGEMTSAVPVRAVSVGIASVVSPVNGSLVRPLMGSEWDGARLSLSFEKAFPEVPVFISNDADLMAVGEYHARALDGHSLVFIKVGTGIGSGVIEGGRLVPGASGGAGDIGQIRIADRDDARCTCGKTGCLTAVASGRAIADRLRALGLEVAGSRDILNLVRNGDLESRHTLRAAAQDIGGVVATLVTFANPDLIVIGGLLGDLCEDLLTDVRSAVYGIAQPLATANLSIESSRLGENAASVGAARVALDHLLSEAGLPRLLRAPLLHTPG